MSGSNENNRPQISIPVGEVTATKKLMAVHASKRMFIKSISLLALAEIVASGSNYVTLQAQRVDQEGNETLIGSPVSTEAGLPAYNPLALEKESAEAEEIDLLKGESLVIIMTVVGSGSLSDAHLSIDAQIKGN